MRAGSSTKDQDAAREDRHGLGNINLRDP